MMHCDNGRPIALHAAQLIILVMFKISNAEIIGGYV